MERSIPKNETRKSIPEPDLDPDFVPGIPDTPENIAKAFLNTPPKKPDEWGYMQRLHDKKQAGEQRPPTSC